MAQIDMQGLANVLHNTLNPDGNARKQAEAQLTQFETMQGSHGIMLELMSHDAIPMQIKQAACVRLKNIYQAYASIRAGELMKISEVDRKLVRDNILEAIIRQTESKLRVQLLEVAYHLWPTDQPTEWESLIPAIVKNLQQGMSSSPPDMLRIYGCVCTLQRVMKRYQFRGPEARIPAHAIVEHTFPMLLQMLQTLAALGPQATEQTREITHILLKIFYLATNLGIPPFMWADFNKCIPWFDVLLFLLEAPVPGLESVQAASPVEAAEKLRESPGWKTKKWASRTLLRIHNRFGRAKLVGEGKKVPKAEREMKKHWATQFETHYTAKVLGILMTVLKAKTQNQYVSDSVLHSCLSYVDTCINSSVHFKMLKPHFPFLVQEVILQTLMLNQADLEMWKEDPQEFVRRSLDLMEEFKDVRMAGRCLLTDMLSFRTKDSLGLTLQTIQHVFDTYQKTEPSQRNFLLKEGAMRMFGMIAELLMSDKQFRDGIEGNLIAHVLPEFNSPHGFLRARACCVIREYPKLAWKNEQAHLQAIKACVDRLADSDLPVKMDAWHAVSEIVEQDKVAACIKPCLPQLFHAFHDLFEEIGSDAVVSVMEVLIERFQDDIIPFAVGLVNKLAEIYLQAMPQILASADNYDEDADEQEAVCYQVLKTIVSTLYAIEKKPELYAQLLEPCCAILDISINDNCVEYYEDILDMLSIFTYQPEDAPIPDRMWKYLPKVIDSFTTFGADFLNCMMPVFDTFISKGKNLLMTPQGQPLLQGMFNISKLILEDQNRLIDSARACVLVESILANMPGMVDALVAPITLLSVNRLITIVELEKATEELRKKRAAAKALRKKKKAAIKKGKSGKNFLSAKDEADDDEDDFKDSEAKELNQLKFGLLDNIGVVCHYNPVLFCQVVSAQPPQWQGNLFNIWLSYMQAIRNDFDVSKNAVLGLASLCALPSQHVPALWRDGMQQVLNQLLFILSEMAKILEEDQPEEDEDAPEGIKAHFHDIHEDEDVYESGHDNDSEDVDEAADGGDDDAPIDLLDDMESAMLHNDMVNKFVSPLDDIDPFVFFRQCIETMARQEAGFYQQWVTSIGPAGQQVLKNHMDQAERHAKEMIEEEKQAKAEKAAAGQK